MHIKAELWDKVQYGFKKYYDGMMHMVLCFDDKLDINAIKAVAHYLAKKISILKSSFINNPVCPYWRENVNISGGLAVKDVECAQGENLFDKAWEFLSDPIPKKAKLQFKVFYLHNDTGSVLAFLVNHMCFDGADFMCFVEKFAECYTALLSDKDIEQISIKNGDRSFNQIYQAMSKEESKKAKRLFKNISKNKNKCLFPFEKDKDKKERDCSVGFTIKRISADKMQMIRERTKSKGATLNDALLSAYFCALKKTAGFNDNGKPITIVSMVNLRRYIQGGQTQGLTNLTGFMSCSVALNGENFENDLQMVSEQTKKAKQDRYVGLYGIPLLSLGFKLIPFRLALRVLHLGYSNPPLSMSNIGRLDAEKLKFGKLMPTDAIITGASKYKPYFQITFNSFNNEGRLCVPQRSTKSDREKISTFLDTMIEELEKV